MLQLVQLALALATLAIGFCVTFATSATPPPAAAGHRVWLAVDPSFTLLGGVRVAVANVTKEPASPLWRPSHPWNVNLGYVTVLHDPSAGKYLAYVASALCCNGGPPGGPPRIWDGDCMNDSIKLTLGHGPRHATSAPRPAAAEAPAPTPTNCTCHADTQYDCKPASCALGDPAPAPNNAACVARCLASLAKDALNGCSATSFDGGRCQMQHSPFARPMSKPGSIGCQCSDQEQPRLPLREVLYCSADGTGSSPPLQGVLLSESTDGISFTASALNQLDAGLHGISACAGAGEGGTRDRQ